MTSPSTPTLRVLAVTNMYPTDRDPVYGSFVRSQMESIAQLGIEVGVHFIDGRRWVWRYAIAAATVAAIASRKHADLIHAHYGLSGFVAAPSRLPLVVSFCGDDLLGTPNGRGALTLKSRLVRALSQVAARRADAIICKSEGLRDCLARERDRNRAHVIPNGVNIAQFIPGDRLEARRRLGLDRMERLVLFPSTATERRKRLDLAQAAVERIGEYGIPARLWVVNHAPPAEMPLRYQAADCLLLTSDWEGSPNVVKEALCCDLPVVSVEAGDVRTWIGGVPGCRLVDRTPEAIADGLRAVLEQPARVDGTRVREALGLVRVAGRIVDVYREAIDHRMSRVGRRS